jgi:hypothetical protein
VGSTAADELQRIGREGAQSVAPRLARVEEDYAVFDLDDARLLEIATRKT